MPRSPQIRYKSIRIFLIDALGALISALMLGLVLPLYPATFGMSAKTLYILALVPLCFVIYDLMVYFIHPSSASLYLRGIAIMNLSYCALSLIVAWQHNEELSALAWAYFIGEVMIIIFLSSLEWHLAKKWSKTPLNP